MTERLIMPQQMFNRAPIGSLLKRSREERGRRTSAPPVADAPHLAAIRQLPCIRCGMEPAGEAAHVRLSSASFGKRNAIGAKPDGRWCVPLCRGCHQDDPDAQHKVGEQIFWDRVGLNPLLVCEALYKVSPDVVKMRAVAFSFIGKRR